MDPLLDTRRIAPPLNADHIEKRLRLARLSERLKPNAARRGFIDLLERTLKAMKVKGSDAT